MNWQVILRNQWFQLCLAAALCSAGAGIYDLASIPAKNSEPIPAPSPAPYTNRRALLCSPSPAFVAVSCEKSRPLDCGCIRQPPIPTAAISLKSLKVLPMATRSRSVPVVTRRRLVIKKDLAFVRRRHSASKCPDILKSRSSERGPHRGGPCHFRQSPDRTGFQCHVCRSLLRKAGPC